MATVAGSKRLLDISGNNVSTAVSLTASGTLLDTNGAAGASNQVLSSTGSGVDWVDASSVIGGPYLPLAGGTLTGDTNLTGSTKKLILKSGAQLGFEDATPTGTIYLYNDGAAVSRLNIGGTMWVEETGNVGIGTTSPQQKLQVASPTDTSVVLGASYSSTNNNNFFEVGISANDGYLNLRNSGVVTTVHIDSDNSSYFNGGNVGIGTTSPGNKLTISGPSSNQFEIINSTNSKSWRPNVNGSDFYITESGVGNPFVIQAGGNVGIGTTSPNGTLNIRSVSSIGSEYNLSLLSNSGTQLFYVRNDGVVVVSNNYLYVTSSQGAYFDGSVKARGGITDDGGTLGLGGGGNTNHLNILTSGNVGIGTTSPTRKLDVAGTSLFQNSVYVNTSTGSEGLYVTRLGAASESVKIYTTDSTSVFETFQDENVGEYGSMAFILDDGAPDPSYVFRYGSNVRLKIEGGTGNVGIGTTSPSTKLHIVQPGGSSQLTLERTGGGAGKAVLAGAAEGLIVYDELYGAKMYVGTSGTYNGNVGIGTTAPSAKLEVTGSVGSFKTTGHQIFLTRNGNNEIYAVGASSVLALGQNNAEKMRIHSNGNVGIGTTSPGGKLTISNNGAEGIEFFPNNFTNGNTTQHYDRTASVYSISKTIAAEYRFNIGTSEKMRINSSGNVGIGTTSFFGKLSVNEAGSGVYFTRSSGDNGTAAPVLAFANDSTKSIIAAAGDGIIFRTRTVGGAAFSGSEKMRITSGGNVGIGTTAPTYKLHVTGTTYANGSVIGSSDLWLRDQSSVYSAEFKMQNNTHTIGIDYQNNETLRFITRSGVTTVPITFQMRAGTITAANFILSSDERKKTKISDLSCDNIDVSWKSFEMKDNEGEYRTGVIAQELEQKHPEFVNTNDEGFKSVKYIDLLIAKIAELEARLEKLEK